MMAPSEPSEAELAAMVTCYRHAVTSPDPSTQNAAVLLDGQVLLEETLAINTLPEGLVVTDERFERPAKYVFVEHAERASLYRAARAGIATAGLTMVCPWAPCAECARAILACGITRLVRRGNLADTHPRWHDSVKTANTMLAEAGIVVVNTTLAMAGLPAVRRDDKLFTPGL